MNRPVLHHPSYFRTNSPNGSNGPRQEVRPSDRDEAPATPEVTIIGGCTACGAEAYTTSPICWSCGQRTVELWAHPASRGQVTGALTVALACEILGILALGAQARWTGWGGGAMVVLLGSATIPVAPALAGIWLVQEGRFRATMLCSVLGVCLAGLYALILLGVVGTDALASRIDPALLGRGRAAPYGLAAGIVLFALGGAASVYARGIAQSLLWTERSLASGGRR